MKIIAHRGGAGLAPENTIKAIKNALKHGVDAIEFDLRLTNDEVFVLNHDADLMRTAGSLTRIQDLSLAELKTIDPFDGEPIPTLDEALKARGKTITLLELKDEKWAKQLAATIKKYLPAPHLCVISFNHKELISFHKLQPDIPCYALIRNRPLQGIKRAHEAGLVGVDIRFWWLNPVTYWYARRKGMDVLIYTVNKPFLMRLIRIFYPKVAITTDYPNLLAKYTKD